MRKRQILIMSYERFKTNSFFGIGQRKAKLFMNAYIKELDKQLTKSTDLNRESILIEKSTLTFLREALECENCNINAKKYFNTDGFSYQDHNYAHKHALIRSLVSLAGELGLTYGYAVSDDPQTRHIVYFDLPVTGEQISFHATLPDEILKETPKYPKEWDHLQNSTLPKIERAFCQRFGDLLKAKYNIALQTIKNK